jgi:hypothetical protein
MENRDELRALIAALVDKIDDTKALRRIYRFINDLFCGGR